MHENENPAKRFLIDKNSMHKTVYSPISHENSWGAKVIPGAGFPSSCMEISFSCMKMPFSCIEMFNSHA